MNLILRSIVDRLKSLFWTMVETENRCGMEDSLYRFTPDNPISFFICEGSLLDSIKKLNKVIKWTQGHFEKTYSARYKLAA